MDNSNPISACRMQVRGGCLEYNLMVSAKSSLNVYRNILYLSVSGRDEHMVNTDIDLSSVFQAKHDSLYVC